MNELPGGWTEVSIADVAETMFDGPFGSMLKTSDYTADGVRVARLENIGHREFRGELKSFVSSEKARDLQRHFLKAGDVLFSSFVDQQTRVCRVPDDLDGQMINKADCFCIRPRPEVCASQFLECSLAAPKSYETFAGAVRGVTRPRIGLRDLATFRIALPPAAEQRRILAKLDALTFRTTSARAELDRVPVLAARYKQGALAAAFSGSLTSRWRSESEPGSPAWEEVTVGGVAEIASGVGFPKDRQGKTSGDYPFAKVSDISRAVAQAKGDLRTAVNYVDEADLRSLRAKPVPEGSVVFAKIGEALRLNRRAVAAVPLVLDNNCMALIPNRERIHPQFLYRFMQTVDLSPLAVATAVPSVRRGDVAALPLPLPPLREQEEIIRLIDLALTEIDRIAAEATAARRLLDRLDQAILTKAFRGELVPQDPADEPATVLLDRIRAAPAPRRGRKAKSA